MAAQYAQVSKRRRREYIYTVAEVAAAARTICIAFLVALASLLITGVVTLAYAPRADVDFEGLSSDAACLRVSRHADYTVVFVDVGSPMQRVKLLLDLETVARPGEGSMSITSSRLHKSLTMACGDLEPPVAYSQMCHDLALVAPNGSASDQSLVHTWFTFQNDRAAYANGQPAAIAGLGGTFRLTMDKTYWLTTTHLCFAPVADEPYNGRAGLWFEVLNDTLVSTQDDLLKYDPSLAFDERCNDALADTPVRLFPAEATNEASVWLTLSGRFLYEYGSSVLEKRRRVVEAGEKCSGAIEELLHQRDIYHSDCGLGLGVCQKLPSVPFRRVATRRLRIDLYPNGQGVLVAEHTRSLEGVKQSYADSLTSAVLRLLVLLLTAAVVFVRGSQNATSARWQLTNVIDALRCRRAYSDDITPENAISRYNTVDAITDALISVGAWCSRLAVLVYGAATFAEDGQIVAVGFQILGLCCSLVHFVLRQPVILDINWKREVPVSTLGGPMSIIDVTSAVLMLFADAPLLGNDGSKFAAIGRLLIALLISLSVGTRICFSVAMLSTMARSATNGNRKDLRCHQTVLWIAATLWLLQAIATAGSLALLFANPAANSLARSQTGPTSVLKYAIFTGLICTSLPTFTKVSLRAYQHECKRE
jgi:hypothetical protein